MDATGWAIILVVVVAVLAIVLMARRRAWNADGSDDARRDEQAPSPDDRE